MIGALRQINSRCFGFNNLINRTGVSKMLGSRTFETLNVSVPHEYVFHVELNRPNKLNAVSQVMWQEVDKCFQELNSNPDCRVIVLSGAGKIFCAGIDFQALMELAPALAEQEDVARKSKILEGSIKSFQNAITSLEVCRKPVLAAIHAACIGAGVDLITAADMRYCTLDAWFQVKEVDIGMAADVGTLQRLPKVIGSESLARELCYTARKFSAAEALTYGFVSNTYDDKEKLMTAVMDIAKVIASKSPVAVQVTKDSLVYSRDHTVQEGLDHIAMWNRTMLQSEDFTNATMAQIAKQKDVKFSKL